MKNKFKPLIFTHGIDIDGYGCAILAKLAFDEPTIIYADNFDLDDKFRKEWQAGTFDNYDYVYVTDHCMSTPLCQEVDKDEDLRHKIMVLDHHKSRLYEQGKIPFVKIIDEDNRGKCCATSLFYEYLNFCGFLKKNMALDVFSEATRLYDTWEWTTADKSMAQISNDLNTLSLALGREGYVERIHSELLQTPPHFFSSDDEAEVQNFRDEFRKQVENYVNEIKVLPFDEFKVGYVEIKDMFKNDIAQKVREQKLDVDFLLMPVPERGTVSLRSVKDVDLGEVAKRYGGGGHSAAASFPLSNLPVSFRSENPRRK